MGPGKIWIAPALSQNVMPEFQNHGFHIVCPLEARIDARRPHQNQ